MSNSGSLFIISAPSGTGKTTLSKALINNMKSYYSIDRVVTYTSRAPRIGEQDGVDYHFISPADFKQKIEQGFFIEWSDVYGTYYGSPLSILDEVAQGHSRILIIDRYGAHQVMKQTDNVMLIWIYPPSLEILGYRLKIRGTDCPESIKKRLQLAHIELDQEAKQPFYHHHILNDLFEETVDSLENIVKTALENKKIKAGKSLLFKAENEL